MKALLFVLLFALMDVMMFIFTMAGIQTIEWCTDKGLPIPWQAFALLVTVGIWCVIAVCLCQKHYNKINRFFTKLTEEE